MLLTSSSKTYEILQTLGQDGFLASLQKLSSGEVKKVFAQIETVGLSVVKHCLDALDASIPSQHYSFFEPKTVEYDQNRAEQALIEGRIGVVLLAGGVGSRLQFPHSKGLFPISYVRKKSLYQLFFERVKAAQERYKQQFPITLMCSDATYKETQNYLREHNFFGIDSSQVELICQESWPLFTFDKQLFLDDNNQLAMGPNGNGALFELFAKTVLQKWKEKNISAIAVTAIDNPLADPFCKKLIDSHFTFHSDLTLATCKALAHEKVGALTQQGNHIKIVEYSEKKDFLSVWANLGIYLFSLSFIEKMHNKPLTTHVAKKNWQDKQGTRQIYKFEKFIFDLLDYTDNVGVVKVEREKSFAALKDKEGEDGPEAVQQALLKRDQLHWSALTGEKAGKIELAMRYYYPCSSLIKKMQRSQRAEGYFE